MEAIPDSADPDIASDALEEKKAQQKIRLKAMDFLARREYSCYELTQRLLRRSYDFQREQVELIITRLENENLLSDDRFVETFVALRQRRGQGPVRIQAELRERGINQMLINTWLDSNAPEWMDFLHALYVKKFSGQSPLSLKERGRQQRFLTYRGFTAEQIQCLFRRKTHDYVE